MSACPCGSNSSYMQCCGQYIENQKLPSTPGQLMRSRYTAFTQANIPYLMHTMKGPALESFEPSLTATWAKKVKWLGLKVLNETMSQENENLGWVEFVATYSENNKPQCIHEISEFHRIDGKWYYVQGRHLAI